MGAQEKISESSGSSEPDQATRTSSPSPVGRYHELDHLRATMMLLGIVIHGLWYYVFMVNPYGDVVSYCDTTKSRPLTWIFWIIHTFRMQVFFLMAGFFTALLAAKRGIWGMLKARLKRVGLPMLVFWAVLTGPLTWFFLQSMALKAGGLAELEAIIRAKFDPNASLAFFLLLPYHLWFLGYLLWFFGAYAILAWLGSIPPLDRVRRAIEAGFAKLVVSPAGLIVPIVLTAVVLLVSPSGLFNEGQIGFFVPDPSGLFAYGLFFGFGGLLYGQRHLLDAFGRTPLAKLTIAASFVPMYLWAVDQINILDSRGTPEPRRAIILSGAVIPWLASAGWLGLFRRYAGRSSPVMRYLADSAYWVYLIHLPVMMSLHILMHGWAIPAEWKAGINIAVTVPVTLGSYHLLVRNTWLGQWLNGRRYPTNRTLEQRTESVPTTHQLGCRGERNS